MAERRMFAKTIVDSDAFLDMPLSAQALYFHLSMRADDDGFVNNPKKIQRMIGASDDDCKLLIIKRFILTFESGVIVIKHWRIHNYIRNDRYKETPYKEEKAQLELTENNAYTEKDKRLGIPNGYQMDTQDRLGKDSVELDNNKILSKRGNQGDIINAIVSHLNERAGTNYRPNTASTVRHINARLNEGFNLECFYAVIDKKVAEWKGTDMEKYLRPETLFGSKFESYLNAQVSVSRRGANGIQIDSRATDELDGIL